MIERDLPLELVLAKGMYLSVTCAEDVPFIDLEDAVASASGTALGSYRLDQHVEACGVWPRGEVPADWLAPVTADVPTLLNQRRARSVHATAHGPPGGGAPGERIAGRDRETYYDHPIAILTGPGAWSNGDWESLRSGFHPRARVFGKPSNGAFTPSDNPLIGREWHIRVQGATP